jgi:hypothetical protein
MGVMGAVLAGRELVAALVDRALPDGAAPGAGLPGADEGPAGPPALQTRFDLAMDGVNRLPRPMLAFATLGFFSFAMIDPARFAERMVGLREVPEPLWWLLAAVVGFYFGAREAHYLRARAPASKARPATTVPEANPALDAWRDTRPD